jgi:3-deoxy-7-phosphoheptulonate synthase
VTQPWTPSSWQRRPIKQQPAYADAQKLQRVLQTLKSYPPLVFAGEVEQLKGQLAQAAEGKRFLLQGGDCAERFVDCNPESITSKLKILLQMSLVLCYGARQPIIRIGRTAGQYAKPRSKDLESIDGVDYPVFRGDNINGFEFDLEARQPDPERLLKGSHLSSLTLNYLRALVSGGFADIHHSENWKLDFLGQNPHRSRYEQVVANILDAVHFMDSLGGVREDILGRIDLFTSHEGLLLGFEESMTRYVAETERYYNLGAHMLWIGDRTRELDGAHVEYFRGISNPIGLKWGPKADPSEMLKVIERLNPQNEAGRIVLISRFGAQSIGEGLPKAIRAVQRAGLEVLWSSDPMHGNVIQSKQQNVKTRNFDDILSELVQSFAIHRSEGSHLGGVHFEMTGEDVTECTGGAEGISDEDLMRHYETFCDPRLNYNQSLEMAFLIAEMLNKGRDLGE